jgi:hypothetical protein
MTSLVMSDFKLTGGHLRRIVGELPANSPYV